MQNANRVIAHISVRNGVRLPPKYSDHIYCVVRRVHMTDRYTQKPAKQLEVEVKKMRKMSWLIDGYLLAII